MGWTWSLGLALISRILRRRCRRVSQRPPRPATRISTVPIFRLSVGVHALAATRQNYLISSPKWASTSPFTRFRFTEGGSPPRKLLSSRPATARSVLLDLIQNISHKAEKIAGDNGLDLVDVELF